MKKMEIGYQKKKRMAPEEERELSGWKSLRAIAPLPKHVPNVDFFQTLESEIPCLLWSSRRMLVIGGFFLKKTVPEFR